MTDIKPWLGKYRIPAEALRIAEDIRTLALVIHLIDNLDPKTIADDYETVRKVKTILTGAKRIAEQTLRKDYMAGTPIKREARETMRDVWQQIL